MWIVIVLISIWLPADAILANTSKVNFEIEKASQLSEWLRLLHYDSARKQSRVDSKEFFLSSQGKYNPRAELEATMAAMSDKGDPQVVQDPRKQHPQCAWPARRQFLKKHGLIDHTQPCPVTDKWLKDLDFNSVSLVYAAAFSENPASMFGHLILRLDHMDPQQSNRAQELLGHGIAFMAQIDDSDNPLSYVFKGLTGGYSAFFNIDTYYAVVGAYNNTESRNLWEYRLALSQEQRDRLAAHLWEVLNFARYDYYFLDENCAFQLLALLEVAHLDWQLLDKTNTFVLPLDALKLVVETESAKTQPQLPDTPHVRYSLEDQWELRLEQLDTRERGLYDGLLSERVSVAEVHAAKVLDAVLAYLNFKRFRNEGKLSVEHERVFQRSLNRRSQIVDKPEALSEPRAMFYPHTSHASRRVELGVSAYQQSYRLLLGSYAGLHDAGMAIGGYEEYAEINYLGFNVSVLASSKNKADHESGFGIRQAPQDVVLLERLLLVEVTSLKGFRPQSPRWAWRLSASYDRDQPWEKVGYIQSEALGGMSAAGDVGFLSVLTGYHAGVKPGFKESQHGVMGMVRSQINIVPNVFNVSLNYRIKGRYRDIPLHWLDMSHHVQWQQDWQMVLSSRLVHNGNSHRLTKYSWKDWSHSLLWRRFF